MSATDPTGPSEREELIDELVMTPMADHVGTDLTPVTRTPRPVTVTDEAVGAAVRACNYWLDEWAIREALEAALPHLTSGASGATLRDDRGVIAAERNEAQRRLEQVETERDSLAAAMWIAYCILGFDPDGDQSPPSWIAGSGGHQRWAEAWLWEIRHHRADLEDERDEAERIEIQRDAALAAVEKVRELAARYEAYGHGEFNIHPDTEGQHCAACSLIQGLSALLPDTPPPMTPCHSTAPRPDGRTAPLVTAEGAPTARTRHNHHQRRRLIMKNVPRGLYRNHTGAELHVVGIAALSGYNALGGDIAVAEARDPLLGTRDYLVTEASLRESGYELIEQEAKTDG